MLTAACHSHRGDMTALDRDADHNSANAMVAVGRLPMPIQTIEATSLAEALGEDSNPLRRWAMDPSCP